LRRLRADPRRDPLQGAPRGSLDQYPFAGSNNQIADGLRGGSFALTFRTSSRSGAADGDPIVLIQRRSGTPG
jgi:hypothetical protein